MSPSLLSNRKRNDSRNNFRQRGMKAGGAIPLRHTLSSPTPLSKSFDSTPFTYLDNEDENIHPCPNVSIQEEEDDVHGFHVGNTSWDWEVMQNQSNEFQRTPISSKKIPHWNRELSPSPKSPSALTPFDYPRKTQTKLDENFQSSSSSPSLPLTTRKVQNLPNPNRIMDQVPFRKKFANAAMMTHQQRPKDESLLVREKDYGDDDYNATGIFNRRSPEIPTQLFFKSHHDHNGNGNNHNKNKSSSNSQSSAEWPSFTEGDWPISHNEESFDSHYGNHSVFSDMTGSEFVSSPKRTHFQTQHFHDLKGLKEEDDEYNFDEKQAVNKTAITQFSAESRSEDEVEDQYDEDHEISNDKERGGMKKSRLASLFTSRGLNYNDVDTRSSRHRSKSAPKSRFDGNNCANNNINEHSHFAQLQASPVRSHTSGSSGGFIGWPGTIGKDGMIVPEPSSSFSDDGQKDFNNVKSNVTNRIDANIDKSDNKNDKKGLGRMKFFARKQEVKGDKKLDSKKSYVEELKRQHYEDGVVDLDDVPGSDSEDEFPTKTQPQNNSDFFSERDVIDRKSDIHSIRSSPIDAFKNDLNMTYPSTRHSSFPDRKTLNAMNELRSPTQSKTLSNTRGQTFENQDGSRNSKNECNDDSDSFIDVSASLHRVRSALSPNSLGPIPEGESSFRLSAEALRRNEQLSPIRSHASGANVKGFRGFLNPTQDVPNLIDDECDSCTSASTRATEKNMIKRTEIADWQPPTRKSNLIQRSETICRHSYIHHGRKRHPSTEKKISLKPIETRLQSDSEEDIKIVKLNPYMTAIQTPSTTSNTNINYIPDKNEKHTLHRESNVDLDWPRKIESSSISEDSAVMDECLVHTYVTPQQNDFSTTDLSQFSIDPSKVRKLVKHYRILSNKGADRSKNEESKKAFALFEMRSRIMESDIERGIDRIGGTKVVDDIALTSYNQAASRVRDAVIVSKAWREGAGPADAKTAFCLTSNFAGKFYMKRQLRMSPNASINGRALNLNNSNSLDFVWERVNWLDDTDFSQIRCSSLGPNTSRGFDIFTMGDCQSILLRLTNEHCEVSI